MGRVAENLQYHWLPFSANKDFKAVVPGIRVSGGGGGLTTARAGVVSRSERSAMPGAGHTWSYQGYSICATICSASCSMAR